MAGNSCPLRKTLLHIIRIIKWIFTIAGAIAFLMLILSFTDLPYYAYHSLGTSNSKLSVDPEVIVILGGSGMPSPDGLIRTYYAAEMANIFEQADIIIAYPYNQGDSLYQLELMAKELIIRGVDSVRIRFEPLGFNTYSQAVHIASFYEHSITKPALLLVTSPEHMYRSVRTFKKAGFNHVGGMPAFEKPIDEEKLKDTGTKEDVRIRNLSVRYNMWSYLNYELLVLREYFAIAYYRLKGWI